MIDTDTAAHDTAPRDSNWTGTAGGTGSSRSTGGCSTFVAGTTALVIEPGSPGRWIRSDGFVDLAEVR